MWTLTIGKTLGQLPRRLFLISSLEFGDIRMKKTEDHRILPWETAGWRNFSFWFHLLVLVVLMLVAIGVILGLEIFFWESFDSFVVSFCSYHDRYIEHMKYQHVLAFHTVSSQSDNLFWRM